MLSRQKTQGLAAWCAQMKDQIRVFQPFYPAHPGFNRLKGDILGTVSLQGLDHQVTCRMGTAKQHLVITLFECSKNVVMRISLPKATLQQAGLALTTATTPAAVTQVNTAA